MEREIQQRERLLILFRDEISIDRETEIYVYMLVNLGQCGHWQLESQDQYIPRVILCSQRIQLIAAGGEHTIAVPSSITAFQLSKHLNRVQQQRQYVNVCLVSKMSSTPTQLSTVITQHNPDSAALEEDVIKENKFNESLIEPSANTEIQKLLSVNSDLQIELYEVYEPYHVPYGEWCHAALLQCRVPVLFTIFQPIDPLLTVSLVFLHIYV